MKHDFSADEIEYSLRNVAPEATIQKSDKEISDCCSQMSKLLTGPEVRQTRER